MYFWSIFYSIVINAIIIFLISSILYRSTVYTSVQSYGSDSKYTSFGMISLSI